DILLKMKRAWLYLGQNVWLILIPTFIGGCVGLGLALFKKPIYIASLTFVLEDGHSGGGLSQYAGLASLMGFDITGSGNGIFQGDNILELYKSRRMITETLLSKGSS